MRTIALWILASLVACGDSRPAPRAQLSQPQLGTRPPTRGPTEGLRVLSYNVNFGIAGERSTLDAIEAVRADLVLLQETNPAWERALITRLGEAYPERRFADPTGWPAGGLAILSRAPIVSVTTLEAPGAPFIAWRVVVDTDLGHLQLLNVHLRPPMSEGGSWVVGYFSTRDDRLREIEHHLAALDPTLPTLIVGDFNEEADGKAMQLLARLNYTDAIATHAGSTRTWEWPVRGLTLRFQLDHILHTDQLVSIAAGVVEAGASDHKPIWADFVRIDP